MDRHVVDEIRLAGLQGRKSRRVFSDFSKNDFLDIRLAAPIVVVAGENKIAAPLIADIFIWAGANGILVHLVAVLFPRRLAQNKAVVQTVQEHRHRLLGHENDCLIVRGLDFGDILEIRRLQAAALFVAHSIDGKHHILGRKRRAVVELDAFFQLEHPPVALKFPGLGEHADEIFAPIIVFDQRLDDMLPVAVDRAGAMLEGMHRISHARMINSDSIPGRGEGLRRKSRDPTSRRPLKSRFFSRNLAG